MSKRADKSQALLLIFPVIVILLMIYIGLQPPKPQAESGQGGGGLGERRCGSARGAYYVAQDMIRARLKSPKSAEFPAFGEVGTKSLSSCAYIIMGYVDSQNGFGAMIRTRYTVGMSYAGRSHGNDMYRLEALAFDE